jgi:hypothetical protein
MEKSVARVLNISNADIRAAIEAAGFTGKVAEDLIETLLQRKHFIELKYPKIAEQFHYKNKQGFQQLWTTSSAIKKLKEFAGKMKEIYENNEKTTLAGYQGGDSYAINPDLFDSKGDISGWQGWKKKFVETMDTLIKKFTFDDNHVLWRGVDMTLVKVTDAAGIERAINMGNYKSLQGGVVNHYGYISSSLTKSSAVKGGPILKRVIFKIDVPAGSHAAFPDAKNVHGEGQGNVRVLLSGYARSEQEVILERGTQLRINRAIVDPEFPNTHIILEVTAIPKGGNLGLKKNNVKKLDSIVQDLYGANKTSSAADDTPLDDIEIPTVDEIVKPQKEVTDAKGNVKAKTISKLEQQIMDLEKDFQVYSKVQENLKVGIVDPEYKKMIDAEVESYNEKIKRAQQKLKAIDAAVECVIRVPR